MSDYSGRENKALGKRYWNSNAYLDSRIDNNVPPLYIDMQDVQNHYVKAEIDRESVKYWVTIEVKKVSIIESIKGEEIANWKCGTGIVRRWY